MQTFVSKYKKRLANIGPMIVSNASAVPVDAHP